MGFNLEGKTVLITGAASGIGRGIVERFVKEGSYPILIDINEEELNHTVNELYKLGIPKDHIGFLSGDLIELDFHKDILSYSLRQFGGIDILVNCAGIFPSKPALEINELEWDRVFDINVKSLFFLTQEVAQQMVNNKKKDCSIINITSVASEDARPGITHYAASKAAVKMLTKVLALEFASLGIRVNAIGPGVVETETLLRTFHTKKAKEEHEEKLSYYPLGRAATQSEVADGVIFLAGNQSTFITGQNILIDGGYSAGRVYKSFSRD